MVDFTHELCVAIMSPVYLKPLSAFVEGGASLPEGMGGYNITNYVCERVSRGLETDVITLVPRQEEPLQRWKGNTLRIWTVRRRERGMCRDFYKKEVSLLKRALHESDANVVHANWTYEYALAALASKQKTLLTVHDNATNMWRHYPLRYAVNFFISMYSIRHATKVCAVSPNIADYLEGKLRRNVPWIGNTFCTEWINGSGGCADVKERLPVICSAVNWSNIKNVKNALRAFKTARSQNEELHYKLIGPGLEVDGPAHHWAQQEGVADGVEFMGRLPYARCLKEIENSAVYFHPSLEESFGCSVAEAMLFKVPVLACKEAAGSAWLLGNGAFGELVSGQSPSDMAMGILRMLDTPPGLTELKRRRHRILGICTPEVVLEQYQKLYSELAVGENEG